MSLGPYSLRSRNERTLLRRCALRPPQPSHGRDEPAGNGELVPVREFSACVCECSHSSLESMDFMAPRHEQHTPVLSTPNAQYVHGLTVPHEEDPAINRSLLHSTESEMDSLQGPSALLLGNTTADDSHPLSTPHVPHSTNSLFVTGLHMDAVGASGAVAANILGGGLLSAGSEGAGTVSMEATGMEEGLTSTVAPPDARKNRSSRYVCRGL
jgi:hypothetical protein